MSKKDEFDLGSTLRKKRKKKDVAHIEKVVDAVHSEKVKRLIIEMPESMHVKIKTRASSMGLTMKAFITGLIEDEMNM